jgi:hypothetical protein
MSAGACLSPWVEWRHLFVAAHLLADGVDGVAERLKVLGDSLVTNELDRWTRRYGAASRQGWNPASPPLRLTVLAKINRNKHDGTVSSNEQRNVLAGVCGQGTQLFHALDRRAVEGKDHVSGQNASARGRAGHVFDESPPVTPVPFCSSGLRGRTTRPRRLFSRAPESVEATLRSVNSPTLTVISWVDPFRIRVSFAAVPGLRSATCAGKARQRRAHAPGAPHVGR